MEPFAKSDLIGTWIGNAPNGAKVSFTFHEDESVINSVNEKGFISRFGRFGLEAKYVIRPGNPYCELDIFDFKDFQLREIVFRGILEPISASEFKMQGRPSNHGARPGHFDDEVILFTRTTPKTSFWERLFRPGVNG